MNFSVFLGIKRKMKLTYDRLWILLKDLSLKKKDLMEKTGLSSATIAKLTKGENVNTDVLLKICEALDCQLDSIVSISK